MVFNASSVTKSQIPAKVYSLWCECLPGSGFWFYFCFFPHSALLFSMILILHCSSWVFSYGKPWILSPQKTSGNSQARDPLLFHHHKFLCWLIFWITVFVLASELPNMLK